MKAAVLALALTGCAQMPPPGEGIETITYERDACKGSCPVYRLSVSSDGAGVFTGIEHVAVIGERRFTVSPAEFTRFRDGLKPWLPKSGVRRVWPGTKTCKHELTDFPSVSVGWARPPQTHSRLSFYYGCSAENPAMSMALSNAVDALSLGTLIRGDSVRR